MKSRATLRIACVLLAAAMVTPGCAAARQRRERQDFLLEGWKQLRAKAGTARFVMGLATKRVPTDHEEEVGRKVVPPPLITLDGEVDLKTHRAVIFAPGTTDPITLFIRTKTFVKRHKRGVGSTDRRDWAFFDFSTAETREEEAVDVRGGLGYMWINPSFFLRFAGGPLLGSVDEKPGIETIRGAQTQHIRGNFDRDKSLRAKPVAVEEDVKAIALQVRAMGHGQPSSFGDMWLDDDGVVRRFQLEFDRRVDRDNTMRTTVAVELYDLGTPVKISTPPRSEAKRVDNHVQLLIDFDVPEAPAPAPPPGTPPGTPPAGPQLPTPAPS